MPVNDSGEKALSGRGGRPSSTSRRRRDQLRPAERVRAQPRRRDDFAPFSSLPSGNPPVAAATVGVAALRALADPCDGVAPRRTILRPPLAVVVAAPMRSSLRLRSSPRPSGRTTSAGHPARAARSPPQGGSSPRPRETALGARACVIGVGVNSSRNRSTTRGGSEPRRDRSLATPSRRSTDRAALVARSRASSLRFPLADASRRRPAPWARRRRGEHRHRRRIAADGAAARRHRRRPRRGDERECPLRLAERAEPPC